jgi:hypothetical protein
MAAQVLSPGWFWSRGGPGMILATPPPLQCRVLDGAVAEGAAHAGLWMGRRGKTTGGGRSSSAGAEAERERQRQREMRQRGGRERQRGIESDKEGMVSRLGCRLGGGDKLRGWAACGAAQTLGVRRGEGASATGVVLHRGPRSST